MREVIILVVAILVLVIIAKIGDVKQEDQTVVSTEETNTKEKAKDEVVEEKDSTIAYLELVTGCECVRIKKRFNEFTSNYIDSLRSQGQLEGYTPVLLEPDAVRSFNVNLKGLNNDEIRSLMEATRKKLLSANVDSGRAFLYNEIEKTKKYTDNRFDHYMNDPIEESRIVVPEDIALTNREVVLVKVPVLEPWKIWAYLPYGAWNACPLPEEHMAVSKYWYETYGAVPVSITYNMVSYILPQPTTEPKKAAMEMYAYCFDIIEQGYDNFSYLAEAIKGNRFWSFWWD